MKDKRKLVEWVKLILFIIPLCIAALTLLKLLSNNLWGSITIIGCSFIIMCVIELNNQEKYKLNNIVEKYDKTLRESLPENSKEKDILELMLANMRELKEYYELSKSHARNAFTLAVTMCILGFILFSMAITVGGIGEHSSWVVSIGGVIIELIAGTSLLVYKNSLTQLNRYYNALHENERFLSMVNLVNKISQEKQDDVYIKIIENQILISSKNEINNNNL